MSVSTGKLIIIAGIGLIILGMFVYFFHDKLQWLGRLPGDIRIEKKGFRFYFPITTLIILSLIINLIILLIRKL